MVPLFLSRSQEPVHPLVDLPPLLFPPFLHAPRAATPCWMVNLEHGPGCLMIFLINSTASKIHAFLLTLFPPLYPSQKVTTNACFCSMCNPTQDHTCAPSGSGDGALSAAFKKEKIAACLGGEGRGESMTTRGNVEILPETHLALLALV